MVAVGPRVVGGDGVIRGGETLVGALTNMQIDAERDLIAQYAKASWYKHFCWMPVRLGRQHPRRFRSMYPKGALRWLCYIEFCVTDYGAWLRDVEVHAMGIRFRARSGT